MFLSTLSLRRATPRKTDVPGAIEVSIHALLAESDVGLHFFLMYHCFYPRSPCGERHPKTSSRPRNTGFLSTLSLRRATTGGQSCSSTLVRFYPRSPCGERLVAPPNNLMIHQSFYPRSPCGERRFWASTVRQIVMFLSTLSLRRATAKVHKTVGHFCAYETNFMGIASSC